MRPYVKMFGSASGRAGNREEVTEFMAPKGTPALSEGQPAVRVLLDRRFRQLSFARLHHKGLIERIPLPIDVRRRRPAAVAHVITDERAGDAELHIAIELLVVIDIDLRDQRFESVFENQEVQVRRTKIVPLAGTDKVAHRTINRDRIARRLDAAKAEIPVFAGGEFAAEIHRRLLWVLLLIEAFRRRMPNVDFGSLDWRSILIFDPAPHEERGARCRRTYDRAIVLGPRRIHTPKRAKQIGGGLGLPLVAVVEQTDQRREAERTGHQHHLIVLFGGHLAEPRQDFSALL